MARRKPKAKAPAQDDRLAAAMWLLVSGTPSTQEVSRALCKRYRLKPAAAERLITQARQRILLAAEYNRQEELGRAITRFEVLYAKALQADDLGECRLLQCELNRLLRLHEPAVDAADAAGSGSVAAVRAHLDPLRLAGEDVPVEELARLAALEIVQLRGRQPKQEQQE